MEFQRTIRAETALSGVGLHTGVPVRARLRPAPANAGIRFFREDLAGVPMVPAKLAFVADTHRGTTLSLRGAQVHTVEHVLSACAGIGVDNLDIVMDGPEPPALDGSALPFLQALLGSGIVEDRGGPRRALRLPGPVRYRSGRTAYTAAPAERFEILCTLEHEDPVPLRQSLELAVDPEAYLGQVAAARTFAFAHELEYLKRHGLAKGGSLKNAILVSRDGVQADGGGLRYPDELVRHKILDLIGDLALLGRSLFQVRIEARRCGHTHNIEFAKMLNDAAQSLRKRGVES